MSKKEMTVLDKAKPNEWTIMVYLAGDNNLAEEMVYALKSMQLVGSRPPFYEVFALYDAGLGPAVIKIRDVGKRTGGLLALAEESRTRELQTKVELKQEEVEQAERLEKELREAAEQTQKKADHARNPSADAPVLKAVTQAVETHQLKTRTEQRLSEAIANRLDKERALNAAEAARNGKEPVPVLPVKEVLRDFVVRTIENNPASHYMIVLSGHGSGAVGDFLTGNSRLFGLSIPELREALGEIQAEFKGREFQCAETKAAPYLKSGKIDILGMDSCLMGMAEVAYEIRDFAHFLVGAEGFEPNTGWPYDEILSLFPTPTAENPKPKGPAPRQLSEAIVETYVKYYASDYTLADISTDLCALALNRIETFAEALGRKDTASSALKEVINDPETLSAVRELAGSDVEKLTDDQLSQHIAAGLLDDNVSEAIQALRNDGIPQELNVIVNEERGVIIKALGEEDGFSQLLEDILREHITAVMKSEIGEGDDFNSLGGDDGLSEILSEVLDHDTKFRDDIKRELRGSEKLADLLQSVLENPEIYRNAVRETFGLHQGLVQVLTSLLTDGDGKIRIPIRDLVVMAHWRTQGYKNEQHADMYDFCSQLQKIGDMYLKDHPYKGLATAYNRIAVACAELKDVIQNSATGVVLGSHYCGPAFQHSHGLSIFFPWASMEDASGIKEVAHYHAALDFAEVSKWDQFLNVYHQISQREPRRREQQEEKDGHGSALNRLDGLFTTNPGESEKSLSSRIAEAIGAKVGTALSSKVGTALSSKVGTALSSKVGTALSSKVGTALSSKVGIALSSKVGTALSSRVGTALSSKVGTALSSRVGTALSSRVGTALSSRVGTALSSRVGTALSSRVGTALSSRVGTALSSKVGTALSSRVGTSLSSRMAGAAGGDAFPKIASMKNPPVRWFEDKL